MFNFNLDTDLNSFGFAAMVMSDIEHEQKIRDLIRLIDRTLAAAPTGTTFTIDDFLGEVGLSWSDLSTKEQDNIVKEVTKWTI